MNIKITRTEKAKKLPIFIRISMDEMTKIDRYHLPQGLKS